MTREEFATAWQKCHGPLLSRNYELFIKDKRLTIILEYPDEEIKKAIRKFAKLNGIIGYLRGEIKSPSKKSRRKNRREYRINDTWRPAGSLIYIMPKNYRNPRRGYND